MSEEKSTLLFLFAMFLSPFLDIGENRRKKEKKSNAQSYAGNWASDKDHEAPIREKEGLTQGLFQHRSENEGEDKRRALKSELSHQVAHDPEEDHQKKIKARVIDAVNTD